MKRHIKLGTLLTLTTTLLLGSVSYAFAEKLQLNNNTSVYMNASDAKSEKNAVKTYSKGEYYVYKRYNGMVNITKTEGVAGAWLSEKYLTDINVTVESNTNSDATVVSSEKVEASKEVATDEFVLSNPTKVFVNAHNARTNTNPRSTYAAGKYYIYKEYNGMINVSRTKGVAGGWINPNSNTSKTTTTSTSKSVNTSQNTSTTSTKLYSLPYFRYHGIIRWEGKKYSYYSQKVLPGYNLKIPGRHVNKDGYVSDGDGYIVLSHKNIEKGTVVDTPFGYQGKVYDRCPGCELNQYDVYID